MLLFIKTVFIFIQDQIRVKVVDDNINAGIALSVAGYDVWVRPNFYCGKFQLRLQQVKTKVYVLLSWWSPAFISVTRNYNADYDVTTKPRFIFYFYDYIFLILRQ